MSFLAIFVSSASVLMTSNPQKPSIEKMSAWKIPGRPPTDAPT